MAFDPKSEADILQLSKAVGYSRDRLKTFRENRLNLIREYVGKHYSDVGGAIDKVPINMLELAMNIYLQRLVAQNPAASITTEYPQLREICTRFELSGNHLIEEIKLGKTLEMVVIGAMFSKGIIKIGLNRSNVEIGGIFHDTGQAFADFVSLDDWVEDMTADSDENSQYEGNYYYPTIDEVEEMFPDWKGKLFPQTDLMQGEDNAHKVQEGGTSTREEFRPKVKLLDLFLKKQNLILQCLVSDDDSNPIEKVLRYFKWKGPENGPYRKLGFSKVENNTMPVAPAMHWIDMHDLINRLFRKLGRQADRQKTITGVRAGADADGNRIIKANDGEMIALDDPNSTKEYTFGGVDATTLAFVLQAKDIFSYMAGNLDMLGGLGPQSDTLGQDQLLSVSASMRIQKMQKEVVEFTQEVLKDLMYYLWYDPSPKQMPVVKKVKGFESVAITVPFNPEDREGDYLQYNIKIVPFSMQHQSPETKMQALRTIFAEFISPLLPMMQAQGVELDIQALFEKISKFSNTPELKDIFIFSKPAIQSEPVGQSGQITAGKAPTTTRRYERINRPGATNAGKTQILTQALLGGKPQASEAASMFRATG